MDERAVKITGKQRRKRSAPPRAKQPKRKGQSETLKKFWASDRGKAMLAERKAHPERYSRRGVPDGMKKPEAMRLWAEARVKAAKAIKVMEENGDLPVIVVPDSDEDKAKRALEEAMVIALSPLTHAPTKVAALRTVLEWTKSKPSQKTEMTISSAEEWLKTVVNDHGSDNPQLIEGSTPALP